MGAPKYNLKNFKYFPAGGIYIDSGAGVVQTTGQDSNGDQVRIWGKWTETGAGAIQDPQGVGFTVAYTGAGIFTVTFAQAFGFLEGAHAYLQAAVTATDITGEIGAFTPGAAGAATLVVLSFASGAAADPATGDYVCFEAILRSEWLD